MGETEQFALESIKKGHDDIAMALHDFDRLGYMVNGISSKGGILEVICRPPRKEDRAKKDAEEKQNLIAAIKQGYGIDESPPTY